MKTDDHLFSVLKMDLLLHLFLYVFWKTFMGIGCIYNSIQTKAIIYSSSKLEKLDSNIFFANKYTIVNLQSIYSYFEEGNKKET